MKKSLVTVDGSAYSEAAFEKYLNKAEKLDDRVTVFRVVETYEYPTDKSGESHKEEIENAEEYTEKLEKKAEKKGIEADSEVKMGSDTATEIVKYADENDYDKIVVGSRGKTGLETVQLGSVSDGVVKRAHCPVLVVRECL